MHLTLIGDFSGQDLEILKRDLKDRRKVYSHKSPGASLYTSASVDVGSIAFVTSKVEGDAAVVGFMTCLNTMPGHGSTTSPNHMNNALWEVASQIEKVLRKHLRLKKKQAVVMHLSAF